LLNENLTHFKRRKTNCSNNTNDKNQPKTSHSPANNTKKRRNRRCKRVDINLADGDGKSPLIYAIRGGDEFLIKRMLKLGADVNQESKVSYIDA